MKSMSCKGALSRSRSANGWRWFVIGLLGAFFLGFGTTLDAAKGGNPGKPGDPDPPDPPPAVEAGLVYLFGYSYAENWHYLIEVNTGDGSARIVREFWQLPTSGFHQPSSHDHNGRWFAVDMLAPEDGEYPASSIRTVPMTCRAIYAMPENGEPIKLTSDPLLETLTFHSSARPRWVAGDSEIWFIARRLYADGEPVPGSLGFYKMGVEFSGGTIQVVSSPTMVANSPVFEADYTRDPADVPWRLFDVLENGSRVIYLDEHETSSRAIFEFDVAAGTHTYIAGSDLLSLDYNAHQDAVVGVVAGAGVGRYDLADGSYSVLVASDRKTNANEGVFSPSGDQVAYVVGKSVRGDPYMSLKFITSDGATDLGDMFTMDNLWILDWFPN